MDNGTDRSGDHLHRLRFCVGEACCGLYLLDYLLLAVLGLYRDWVGGAGGRGRLGGWGVLTALSVNIGD